MVLCRTAGIGIAHCGFWVLSNPEVSLAGLLFFLGAGSGSINTSILFYSSDISFFGEKLIKNHFCICFKLIVVVNYQLIYLWMQNCNLKQKTI